ncbi:TPA: TIGR00730 family Rossman fold protein [Candidatus Dependentiae bacterium]|nr:TIGR00730 family Rossman fold protein [Candidatus Dependentiae bacterium]HBZ73327.1 TIGR00730 family Rossman fold protein [Candidatus Dependentiae bacterium]
MGDFKSPIFHFYKQIKLFTCTNKFLYISHMLLTLLEILLKIGECNMFKNSKRIYLFLLILFFSISTLFYLKHKQEISLFIELGIDSYNTSKGLHKIKKLNKPVVTFFGGSRIPKNDFYYIQAEKLASLLADKGFVIMSGGGPGIMEAANSGAIKNMKNKEEIRSISANLHLLTNFERSSNPSQLKFLHDKFWSRKLLLINNSNAFIVFPGGTGTINELSELLVLMEIGALAKKTIILFDSKYWKKFIDWMNFAKTKNLISQKAFDLILIKNNIEEIFNCLIKENSH